jgi:peroxiredoxin
MAVAALAVLLVVGVGGCNASPGTARNADAGNAGYVSGDGSVTTWPVANRGKPVELAGTDFSGAPVDVAAHRGQVVVINTWYAACPPCRTEAPDLVRLANDDAARGVTVIGLNGTDDAGAAQAFERTFAVPYPSIDDRDGRGVAALQGVVPISAVPTTVLLDREGRVAARILGRADASTLRSLVDDLVAAAPTGA